MRPAFIIALIAALPLGGLAQVLPAGASTDAVIRALGAPRARSATKAREIWLYPGFEVVFENGRLVSLIELPATAGNADKKSEAMLSRVSTGGAMGVASTPRIAIKDTTAPDTTKPAIGRVESGKMVLRSPERRDQVATPVRPNAKGQSILWLAVSFVGCVFLGLSAALAWTWKRRIEESKRWFSQKDLLAAGSQDRATEPAGERSPASRPTSLADWELTPELLRTMEWKRFERLVERYYSASGFRTKGAGVGADNGVDIYLFRGGSSLPLRCVQCKGGGIRQVELAQLRELFGAMTAQKIPEGAMVTTGVFSSDALNFGRQNRLNLISGDALIALFNRLPHLVRQRILGEVTEGDYTTPSCPRCGVKLGLKLNPSDQLPFWSCQRYPKCHYTLAVSQTAAASTV